MKEIERLKALGIAPADILLPVEGMDLTHWAVIACDQYTSAPGYWEEVNRFVGAAPSALRLIIPEAWLETPRGEALQTGTVETMQGYISGGVFRNAPQSFVYVERSTPFTTLRRGLVAAFDLEKYDFTPGNRMPIRATEGTILKRLPPRVAIRRKAALECPHIMILLDDPQHTVIEPLAQKKAGMDKLYDTELMAGAGHVSGWRVDKAMEFGRIAGALEKLNAQGGMLFAMGDGNHSLATAKAWWDELKQGLSAEERETHPARWALAELVNLHDDGLTFHPIHRVAFNVDAAELLAQLFWNMNQRGWGASMGKEQSGAQSIEWRCAGDCGFINITKPGSPLAVGSLQEALDHVLPGMPEARLDYVHGDESAEALGEQNGNMAFLLKAMNKNDLFPAVEKLGVLPRKAFSMGEAPEKRFYLECRKIVK
jgi:hypothetical protein